MTPPKIAIKDRNHLIGVITIQFFTLIFEFYGKLEMKAIKATTMFSSV